MALIQLSGVEGGVEGLLGLLVALGTLPFSASSTTVINGE
jgi:hypothetical protein